MEYPLERCQGSLGGCCLARCEPGPQGEQGDPGLPGEQGLPGEPGADGLSCWDLNGNGVADPEEDINGDGDFNAWDCRGADGLDGEPGETGEPGLSCWDLNGNGIGESEEDINDDGDFDTLDCQGPPGEPARFQVVASGVVRDDGSTQSGNNILSSAWLGYGYYEVVFDVSEVDIPDGADAIDFPVFVMILEPYEPEGDERHGVPIARYLPVSLEEGVLTIYVHIRGPYYWPLDSWFSVQVLEPGLPLDDPNDAGT